MIGIGRKGERTVVVINWAAATDEGAQLSSRLLQLNMVQCIECPR